MKSIRATEARANFADLLRRVSVAKERIVIERRGHPAVAMVPVEDLEALAEATGRPVEHAGRVQDVTELERAREALRESEQRLDFITENSNVAIFISRISDGTFKYFNAAAAEIFGLPAEALAGRSTREFYHDPGDRRRLLKELEEKGAVRNFELQVKRADGSTVWVLDSVTRTKFQGEEALLSTIVDITERKQAEETLRRAHDELERRVEERTRELHASNRALEDEIAVREQSEEALQHSEAMLAGTLDIMLEAVISVDGQQRIQLFNKGAETVFGYSSEEIIGQPLERLLPVRFKENHHRHVREFERSPAVSRLMVRRGEIRGLRSDGAEFPAEASISKFEVSGETRFTVVLRDITERKRADAALRASEGQVRLLMNSTAEAIYGLDLEGNCSFANPACAEMLGYDRAEDLLGKHMHGLIHHTRPDGTRYPAEECLIYQAFARGEGTHVEDEVLWRRDGTSFPAEYRSHPVRRDGEVVGAVVTFLDITERRRAEAALRESDARLRDAIESISEGFILYDAHDRLVLCNSKYRDFYPSIADMLKPGARLEDVARAAFEAGAVQGSAENIEKWMEMRLEQHRTGQGTHEQNLKDGTWVLCSERKTSSGGTVGIRTDITERRRTEEQLRQAQKLEAVGQLTGGIAHDFNNLLTIIMGNLDMLYDHLGDDPPARIFAQSALEATFRGAELTQQLLAFSRKQTLAPKLTDANALVSSMTELMRRSLAENIEIETVLAGGIWKTVVDQGQLENALLNLAINARDAMPDGGKLTIRTANRHLDADDPGTPAEAATGPYVMISVNDTGTGMAPEVIEHVFEPFFTTKGVGKGSGLGLSMVYGFIKQSGGHIAIHSEVGRGTTVALYLPKAAALDEEKAAAERKPKALPRGEETVLVVEDDPDVRSFVTNALRGLGYDVLEADDGPSVLSLLDDMPEIDLLVSDVVLPGGMNGLQIAEAIRKLRPRIKVLFTSGYAQSAIVHHGQLDEGVELLAKPFTREALARRVREVLDAAGDR
ncbi:MAG: type II toxin-antitoxin system prevent-host-death family antitoxin [Proteobacteria bacterium]|nr:type II toxin-antitoxin system prevent-host-death family antitoxin [Pseudomonadota bacterium]